MSGALTRFRVMAWVTGVMLLVLVFVAMPVRYIGGEPVLSETISPIHGFLYMVYLVVTVDLASRMRWRLSRTLLVMLAGTIPFMSFVFERKVTHEVRARMDSDAASTVTEGSSP